MLRVTRVHTATNHNAPEPSMLPNRGLTMTILRVGATQKYSDNFAGAFGKPKKKTAKKAAAKATKKVAAKKSVKKKTTKKKVTKKKT